MKTDDWDGMLTLNLGCFYFMLLPSQYYYVLHSCEKGSGMLLSCFFVLCSIQIVVSFFLIENVAFLFQFLLESKWIVSAVNVSNCNLARLQFDHRYYLAHILV